MLGTAALEVIASNPEVQVSDVKAIPANKDLEAALAIKADYDTGPLCWIYYVPPLSCVEPKPGGGI